MVASETISSLEEILAGNFLHNHQEPAPSEINLHRFEISLNTRYGGYYEVIFMKY